MNPQNKNGPKVGTLCVAFGATMALMCACLAAPPPANADTGQTAENVLAPPIAAINASDQTASAFVINPVPEIDTSQFAVNNERSKKASQLINTPADTGQSASTVIANVANIKVDRVVNTFITADSPPAITALNFGNIANDTATLSVNSPAPPGANLGNYTVESSVNYIGTSPPLTTITALANDPTAYTAMALVPANTSPPVATTVAVNSGYRVAQNGVYSANGVQEQGGAGFGAELAANVGAAPPGTTSA